MLNFTEDNFTLERMKQIKELINNAEFISFDCEFLAVSHQTPLQNYDSQNDIYLKKKEVVKNSQLTQLGMTVFTKFQDEFQAVSLNFYVAPQKRSRKKRVQAESSCLYFLCEHDFDFKKCFYQGIDFIRLENLEEYKKLSQCSKNTSINEFVDKVQENIEDLDYVGNFKEKFQNLFKQKRYPEKHFIETDLMLLDKFEEFHQSEEHTFKYETDNKNLIRYLTSPLSQLYNRVYLHNHYKLSAKSQAITLKRRGTVDELEIQNSTSEEKPTVKNFDKFNLALLIHQIIKKKIPVVFHNGVFDYLYMYETFIEDLPNNVQDLVDRKIFNQIYDTKYMATQMSKEFKFNKTSLEELYRRVEKHDSIKLKIVTQEFKDQYPNEKDEFHEIDPKYTQHHQAAYDSLLTGIIYQYMSNAKFKEVQSYSNKLAEKLNLLFQMDNNFNPNEFSFFEQKALVKNTFFIQYQQQDIDKNLQNNLILQISQFGQFKVKDNEQDLAIISLINNENDINEIVDNLRQKFPQFKFQTYKDFIKTNSVESEFQLC